MVSRAKETHTPNRVMRMGDEWVDVGEAAGKRQRTVVFLQFARWYLRYPGAKLPERPPARNWEARHAERAAEQDHAAHDASPGS